VLVWPDRSSVDWAVRQWVSDVRSRRKDIVKVGYFGSYARGDWGPGSDLDLVIVVESEAVPFHRRSASWDVSRLPVPADVIVYTLEEWGELDPESRFYRILHDEAIWI
jgi:predicted nucleotidyltransferase